MVSRRRALRLGLLAATAGCLDGGRRSTATPSTATDGPRRTPGDVAEWTPEWSASLDDRILGLDTADGRLYATLGADGGPTTVAAVDPSARSVRWRTETPGEPVGGSHAPADRGPPDQWGVTPTDDAVYVVSGRAEEREWSAVHAVDRATGDRRWSFRRDRRLGVLGVADGLLVVTGVEFFPASGRTPRPDETPSEPLSTVVYGVDPVDGTVRWTRSFAGVRTVGLGAGGPLVATDRLVALDRAGRDRFTYDAGPPAGVETAGDRVFYLTSDGADTRLHGVDASGTADWTRSLPVAELLVADGRCYAVGDALVAVETDGTVAWRRDDRGRRLLLDPDGDTLYARTGVRADVTTAYGVDGTERWTFDPRVDDAWPEVATSESVVVAAITGDAAADPFLTLYAVSDDGRATASRPVDGLTDAVGLNGTVYLPTGDATLAALVT